MGLEFDVGDDQGDAGQVTHGRYLAQDDQSGSGCRWRAVHAACGWVEAQS
jgi:hypothetical protein